MFLGYRSISKQALYHLDPLISHRPTVLDSLGAILQTFPLKGEKRVFSPEMLWPTLPVHQLLLQKFSHQPRVTFPSPMSGLQLPPCISEAVATILWGTASTFCAGFVCVVGFLPRGKGLQRWPPVRSFSKLPQLQVGLVFGQGRDS